jgi:mRNA interferase RelE/StbE
MAEYEILFKKSVQKDFNVIPKKDLKKVLERVEAFAADPRPPGCEKLTGQQRYRLRQGRYRILYSIQDDELTVWVVKVGHRKDNLSLTRTNHLIKPTVSAGAGCAGSREV